MNDSLALQKELFTKKDVIATSSLSIIYLMLSGLLIGFKSDQLILVVVFNSLYYLTSFTRKFIIGFSIFIVYWIIFDYMKVYPNYLVNQVSIENLYDLEKRSFGIQWNGRSLTPNEYWIANSTAFLDIIGGIFYLMWIPVPLAFAAYLFFKNRRQFLYFSLTFILVNFIGFVIYYIYPAAPPWYVQYYGFGFEANTASNPAGLLRFDQYLGIPVFQSIYSKGSNVFAAMPSLHSSYPLIVLYYGIKNKLKKANIFFAIVMLGIWFTAVYSSHHYILDVLAGILCAIAGILFFNRLKGTRAMKSFLRSMLKAIT